jgi:hypothetical protein
MEKEHKSQGYNRNLAKREKKTTNDEKKVA